MNRIEALRQKSEYAADAHRVIVIDGQPLDHLVARCEPYLKGLVPTLLDWLDNAEERRVTWDRILPGDGKKTIAPVLMCPDDCDFTCTIVVAEVERTGNLIRWSRFGLDSRREVGDPEAVGETVDWFELNAFRFDLADYLACLSAFEEEAGGMQE